MPTSDIENTPLTFSTDQAAAAANSYSWWGMLGTLLVFVLILVTALWVIKRLNNKAVRGMDTPWARVLDRQILNGPQALYLVEIAGKLQVLGVSDHYMVKISEIDQPEVAAEILEEIANRPVEKAENFLNLLTGKIFGRRKPKRSFRNELERLLEEVEK